MERWWKYLKTLDKLGLEKAGHKKHAWPATALLLKSAGLFGRVFLIAVPLGLGGLAIGLVTMFSLPKELGVSHQTLLYDHSTTNA